MIRNSFIGLGLLVALTLFSYNGVFAISYSDDFPLGKNNNVSISSTRVGDIATIVFEIGKDSCSTGDGYNFNPESVLVSNKRVQGGVDGIVSNLDLTNADISIHTSSGPIKGTVTHTYAGNITLNPTNEVELNSSSGTATITVTNAKIVNAGRGYVDASIIQKSNMCFGTGKTVFEFTNPQLPPEDIAKPPVVETVESEEKSEDTIIELPSSFSRSDSYDLNKTDNYTEVADFYLSSVAGNKIEFLEKINLRELLEDTSILERGVIFGTNSIEINPDVVPYLNVPAKITLKNVSANLPMLVKNGKPYFGNKTVKYDRLAGEYSFTVSGFSKYQVMEGLWLYIITVLFIACLAFFITKTAHFVTIRRSSRG